MAADNGAEIDLYDNIEEDFVQDSSELTELYDDVLVPSSSDHHISNDSKPSLSLLSSSSLAHTGRRIATYVGNLTWWTTDVDLQQAFNNFGISDVLEIKFHENRQNGQSKGFCVVVFGSEQSVKIAMDKMTKVDLNGQPPLVTYCTKHNLNIFEKAAGSDSTMQSSSSRDNTSSGSSGILGVASTGSSTRNSTASNNGRLPPPLMSTNPLPALGFSLRGSSSLMGRASNPSNRQNNSLSLGFSNIPQTFQNLFMSGSLGMQLPTGLQTNQASSLLSSGFGLPGGTGTNAHINPNFLNQSASGGSSLTNPLLQASQLISSGLRPQIDQFGRPLVQTYTPNQHDKLSESEFEDIMQKNKTVSSIAINRAVQDAAGGNYASAIETLVTAISLIKQSKISNDDRCKILINSLQDTLHGIESKSYGSRGGASGSSSRHRRRSYSDSGDEGRDGGRSGYGDSNSSSRHRDKGRRSRSREGRRGDDRHNRSHDRDRSSGRDYYGQGGSSQDRYRQ